MSGSWARLTLQIVVLGSTGSIGQQTLALVDEYPERFRVVGLAGGTNLTLLQDQIKQYRPALASVSSEEDAGLLDGTEIMSGSAGLEALATMPEADIIVVATSGHAAIVPTLKAIRSGKTIALANKEVIVCAGEIIMAAAKAHGCDIRPVDSEHSAVWQCLGSCLDASSVDRIVLTASGGPFLTTPLDHLADVTVEQALKHPNWNMGNKITIDSATMMNKGLEVIEAHWLFDLAYDQIDVIVHPESTVHSLVSFVDGSTMAQLGIPDMRIPILYALTHPERAVAPERKLDIQRLTQLNFAPIDDQRFPALRIARQAGEAGGTFPTVLSSADEVAVDAFLNGKLRFREITEVIETVLNRHDAIPGPLTLDAVSEADSWARRISQESIASKARR